MTCARKKFPKTKICSADLRHRAALQLRTLGGTIGTPEPTETFTTVTTRWAAIETTEGTKRFAGVAIDDRATHLFWIRYDAALTIPEDGNHFMLYDDRRFRVLRVTIDGEDKNWFIIQCTERGDDDQDASGA
jgi:SPP1 family predicted phage head-tail adaptor